MNFFEHQAKAKQSSRWLIILFILAVVSTITIGDLIVYAVLLPFDVNSDTSILIHVYVMIALLAVMMIGTFHRTNILKSGGKQVAEELGAKAVPTSTEDPKKRTLINVVEEIAIAAGCLVPPTYIIETNNLNAFVAGHTIHDAVIVVTSGMLDTLNREELQGVIGHEFSHIINGDMRLNLKLTGILYGILFMGLTGRMILESEVDSSVPTPLSDDERFGHLTSEMRFGNAQAVNTSPAGHFVLLGLLGLLLTPIGYAGSAFGNLIKATLNRQREFLADASSVQFTRNALGLSNALKKIGSSEQSTTLSKAKAVEFSHFYFLPGITHKLSWYDTHPPIKERILRLDPDWDGQYPTMQAAAPEQLKPKQNQPIISASVSATAVIETIMMAGLPSNSHISYAQQLVHSIPKPLRSASQIPLSAYAMMLGLVMHQSLLKDRAAQLGLLPDLDDAIMQELSSMLEPLQSLQIQYRLPLIATALPALKSLSDKQKSQLDQDLLTIIHADNVVEVWEWALHYWITQLALKAPVMPTPKYNNFSKIAESTSVLISTVAYASSKSISETGQRLVLQAAERELGITIGLVNKSALSSDRLIKAVDDLRYLQPLLKANFLKSLVLAAQHDGVVETKEVELIRTIAEGIGCPIPPVVPES